MGWRAVDEELVVIAQAEPAECMDLELGISRLDRIEIDIEFSAADLPSRSGKKTDLPMRGQVSRNPPST